VAAPTGTVNVNTSVPGEKRSTRVLPANAAGIAEAARLLSAGGLVAFPTETVYGLGANASDARAVARLYEAKERPAFNPLIAHVPDIDAARAAGRLSEIAVRLAKKFWPGPLTLVVPTAPDCPVCELARAGLDTVALRMPAHPVAQPLLKAVGRPVVAPSANRSGHVSPTRADHVLADLGGRIDIVLDGGPTPLGLESTILDCTGTKATLLRPGAISREAIEGSLGESLENAPARHDENPVSPGRLPSHYATRARLRLDVMEVEPGEALLTFGPTRPAGVERASHVLDLSPKGDLIEAAANLFAHLRALDATNAASIAVAPIPANGLGEAIRDRLMRAAAPRST
jgi:L-threonylcarbamoyladenylate synthase